MSGYTIIVFIDGSPSYVAGWEEDFAAADKQVADMASKTSVEDGVVKPVFDGNDDIVVFDANGQAVSAWNRTSTKTLQNFASFDFVSFLEDRSARKEVKLLGFQIQNLAGENIQGTPSDPFQLSITDVLIDGAVLTAKGWATDKDFLVEAVFSNEIDDATFVSEIEMKDDHVVSPGM